MDPQAVETEARSAIAGASTLDELDDARVRYLGRKSELKQALREVRDAETGSVLNALRQTLEDAVTERQAELERADLDRRLTEEVADVTLPGERRQRGHLHLITQIRREVEDIFLGLGSRSSTAARSRRRTTTSTRSTSLPTTRRGRLGNRSS